MIFWVNYLKVSVLNNEDFEIYINEIYLNNYDIKNENDLSKLMKKIVLLLKRRYEVIFSGIYNVQIYASKLNGAFLFIKRLDSLFSIRDIDFKISVFFDCDFYFKTKDFFVVEDLSNIFYYNGFYYIKCNLIKNISKIIEFGSVEYLKDFDLNSIGTRIK